MKAVMISIKPKYVELIANGQKTIEVRKTRPKIDTPFKCYIYCTEGDALALPCLNNPHYAILRMNNGTPNGRKMTIAERGQNDHKFANRKVIGEFVCDRIDAYSYDLAFDESSGCFLNSFVYDILSGELWQTCLSYKEFENYGNGELLNGWHISDLVIYDEPKELGEFWAYNAELNKRFNDGEDCCAWGRCETESGCSNDCDTENILNCYQCWADWNGWCHKLTRPPQSWQFVEEKE